MVISIHFSIICFLASFTVDMLENIVGFIENKKLKYLESNDDSTVVQRSRLQLNKYMLLE